MKKSLLLLSFLLITISSLYCQTYFSAQKNIIADGTTTWACDIVVADIDGDGDNDVIGASASDGKISLYENISGTGTFAIQKVIDSGIKTLSAIWVADLDNDGDQDIIAASCGTSGKGVKWYRNTDGRGTFSSMISLGDNDWAVDVCAADVDNDGDMDIVATSTDFQYWFENTNGQGTFSRRYIINTVSDCVSMCVTDIDNDGYVDMVLADNEYGMIWCLRNIPGQHKYGWPELCRTDDYTSSGIRSVFASDINGDGKTDILSASTKDDEIAWYRNQGDTLGPQRIITSELNDARSVSAADLDGDGDMDVIAGGSSKIAWYRNTDGKGTFSSAVTLTTHASTAMAVCAADINSDGDNDIFAASQYDNRLVMFRNLDGEGDFGDMYNITRSANSAESVFAADLDGDGDMDVLSASSEDNRIAWYENTDRMGTFGTQNIISTRASRANYVHAADIDGDGDMDALSASMWDNKIAWYENEDGLGDFGTQIIVYEDASNVAWFVYGTDIDGDGDNDILAVFNESDCMVYWFENTDGKGTFSSPLKISTALTGVRSAYPIDIDNDGDMDIVTAGDVIGLIKNTDGQGTFGTPMTISTDSGTSVFAADMDGDGDMDVLSALYDNKIAWYENTTGTGVFGEQQVISSETDNPQSVFATDIDGDGDMDVLSASADDDRIRLFENTDGHGTFGAGQRITYYANGARQVYAADINGDGAVDVLSASASDSKIAWYENLKPEITQQPDDAVTCPWSPASFATAAGYVNDYQWQLLSEGSFTDLSDDETFSGTTTASLTISQTLPEMTGTEYRCLLTNNAGTIISDTITLSIEDLESPVITSTHEDQLLIAGTDCSAVIPDYTSDVAASDNCDATPVVTQTPEAGTGVSGADNPVVLRVTDATGNYTEKTFLVSVTDDTDPTVTCPADMSVNISSGSTSYTVEGTAFDLSVFSDNCSVSLISNNYNSSSSLASASFTAGSYVILWTVTDASGNTASCSNTITVSPATGTEEAEENGIKVFPNPFTDRLNIDTQGNYVERITLMDLSGKVVLTMPEVQSQDAIDMSGYAGNIYFVVITTADKTIIKKMIKAE